MAAYNPTDTLQQRFLAAIALGESGKNPNAYNLGVGGTDLSGRPRDQYGFPVWSGIDLDTWQPRTAGDTGQFSRAAGKYQFVPGTWKQVAEQYGLDFTNPADQNAGAWYNAEREFKENTGGDLYQALADGKYDIVQNALKDEWTSVVGNASLPGGLANALENGIGATIAQGFQSALGFAGLGANTGGSGGGGIGALIGNIFVRGALIIVGVIILVAALWALLARYDVVPSPAELAPGNT